jgi:hypothetical protein
MRKSFYFLYVILTYLKTTIELKQKSTPLTVFRRRNQLLNTFFHSKSTSNFDIFAYCKNAQSPVWFYMITFSFSLRLRFDG